MRAYKRDFENIAEALGTTDAPEATIKAIGDILYRSNGNFDRQRFENRIEGWKKSERIVHKLISDAAEAIERFSEDDLETHALRLRGES